MGESSSKSGANNQQQPKEKEYDEDGWEIVRHSKKRWSVTRSWREGDEKKKYSRCLLVVATWSSFLWKHIHAYIREVFSSYRCTIFWVVKIIKNRYHDKNNGRKFGNKFDVLCIVYNGDIIYIKWTMNSCNANTLRYQLQRMVLSVSSMMAFLTKVTNGRINTSCKNLE